MARQMSFEEMLPDGFKKGVRSFSDGEFLKRRHDFTLPGIRNRHEAYGYLTECFVGLNGAVAAIKTAMNDATKLLPTPDDSPFVDTVQVAYSAALDAAIAAINMAVQAQNITEQLVSRFPSADPTPMEEMAADTAPVAEAAPECATEVEAPDEA